VRFHPLHSSALLAALAIRLSAGSVVAQQPTAIPRLRAASGAAPDTVTVGDRFRVLLRVAAPAGARVSFGALPTTDSVQSVGRLRVSLDARGGAVATYTLAAWATGDSLSAVVPVTISLPGGESSRHRAPLRLPVVRSVLPADGEEVRPRSARGLLPFPGARPLRWPWMAAAALLAALALAAGLWLRRRRRRSAPPVDPREAALAELDRIAALQISSAPDAERVVALTTRALRVLLAATQPGLGEDLTSGEVVLGLGRAWGDADAVRELGGLLDRGDRVKFARAGAGADEARRFVETARAWVASRAAPGRREAA
jgi:hypothetical protein